MRRACGEELNIELITLLRNLAEALQCKVGMKSGEDYDDALSVLHDYPEMTIEEVRLCFAWIRQGKIGGNWFERFKAPQLRECLGQFCAMRSEQVLEQRHKTDENYPRMGTGGGSDIIKRLIADLDDKQPKPYTDDWLSGKRKQMTEAQRKELQEKDKSRRFGE